MLDKRIPITDGMFLAAESRESMMHVGALLPFAPGPSTPSDLLHRLMQELRAPPPIQAPWNWKLRNPERIGSPRQRWIEDEHFDLDYHVRHSALPSPGGERELGVLVSRLHSVQLDFHRPLWEAHFIEGLERGRVALYVKVHHALIDGYTAMRVLASSMSTTPDDPDTTLFFLRAKPQRAPVTEAEPTLSALLHIAREQVGGQPKFWRALGRLGRSIGGRDAHLAAPLQAPPTILNRRISRNRRFATQSFPLERLKAVARTGGGTLNDVALALCGSALRRHLSDLGALPDAPLIAMLPVNIRPADDPGGGNAIGAILASLATHLTDPVARLHEIVASTRRAKAQLEGMPRSMIVQYSALLLSPLIVQLATGIAGRVRPVFNVVISNVPGPSETLWFRGARLEAAYPLSVPVHGYGLNITLNSYAGTLNFGFTGCRDAIPSLQRLAVYAAEALDDLEAALR